VALVVVLLLVAMVAALASEMIYESRIQMALARNYQDHLRARYVAKAGFNIARGLLTHTIPFESNRVMFQNDFINLFRCQCLSLVPEGSLGLTEEQSREQAEKPPQELEGCGLWKLAIAYPIEDDLLDLSLTDEQTRLNLNALVTPSVSEEGGAREDPKQAFRGVLRTLFLYQANRHQLTLTEAEADAILDYLADWLDYGVAGDESDSDNTLTFEDGDRIYSNKNGPLDTLDELRMIPGMTDDLFYAVRDYLTVYPIKTPPRTFSSQVNLNLASQEVLLALICGTTEGVCDFDKVMSQVLGFIQAGFGENGFIKDRLDIPFSIKSSYQLQPGAAFRYYRIVSSGVTESGVVATIQAVVRVGGDQQKVAILYWSED
jgi:type II secretory pathway component PulK